MISKESRGLPGGLLSHCLMCEPLWLEGHRTLWVPTCGACTSSDSARQLPAPLSVLWGQRSPEPLSGCLSTLRPSQEAASPQIFPQPVHMPPALCCFPSTRPAPTPLRALTWMPGRNHKSNFKTKTTGFLRFCHVSCFHSGTGVQDKSRDGLTFPFPPPPRTPHAFPQKACQLHLPDISQPHQFLSTPPTKSWSKLTISRLLRQWPVTVPLCALSPSDWLSRWSYGGHFKVYLTKSHMWMASHDSENI